MTSLRLRFLAASTVVAAVASFPSSDAHACVGSEPACSGKREGDACRSQTVFGVCRKMGCAEAPAYSCEGRPICGAADKDLRDACEGKANGDACTDPAKGAGTCVAIQCAAGVVSYACYVPRSSPPPSNETPALGTPTSATPGASSPAGSPTDDTTDASSSEGGCSTARLPNAAGAFGSLASIGMFFAAALARRRARRS